MRPIDADALKDHLKSYTGMFTDELGFVVSLVAVLNGIDFQPTIESESVRHGEWIDTGIEELDLIYSGYKCSQCGFILCGNQTKYCPGCGAKMDKKSPENHKKYQEEETNKKAFK